jgi:hypothetical protein
MQAAQAAEQEQQRQLALQQWAEEQRMLIRRDVEQEFAERMAMRQSAAVAENPLNARPAGVAGVGLPPNVQAVVRQRFARPEMNIQDPFDDEEQAPG